MCRNLQQSFHTSSYDTVTRGDLDVVRNLIKRQRSLLTDLSPSQGEPLHRVAIVLRNPDDMVHLLLEADLRIIQNPKGLVPDEKEMVELGEAVFEASRSGYVKQVETLLQRGGTVKYCDQYGLTTSACCVTVGDR